MWQSVLQSVALFQGIYICLANSKLRFMYCAKSAELIGDCCDASIFFILRSVTSLWNWFRNVILHKNILVYTANVMKFHETLK